MRISNQQCQQNEARIRASMDRLLRGDIPAGGSCDTSTLAKEAGVDRTAFYGTRPYTHLREESKPGSLESAKPATPSAPQRTRSADSRPGTRSSKAA
ncbi:hypothetical protein [Nocardia brasiliensis]|uniref:hypothetical protein n=1 Tax=Nocardia brasiliensis TaxID=37326 RepID=UPI001EEB013E|nr:hypothetical protein [Nocardia brasiliensis]